RSPAPAAPSASGPVADAAPADVAPEAAPPVDVAPAPAPRAPAPVEPMVAEPPPDAVPENVAAVDEFYEPLSPYGMWVDYPSYGRVWVPNRNVVGADFRPYTYG